MRYQDPAFHVPAFIRSAGAVCALALAAGCETLAPPTAPAVPPPATLLNAGVLELPSSCSVPAGQPYRVSYVVDAAGRAGKPESINPPDAPACLQDALKTWIATFRYGPVGAAERLTADWMLVTARRGS